MNRHPAVVARMASTLQIASGGRLLARDRDRRAPEGARGVRHRLPAAARAGRAARGGRRGDPRAVDGRAGDARVAVLPAGRGVRPAGAGTRPADHHRWRDRGRGAAGGRIGDGWSVVRRQLRGEPARLPRGARRRPASGARTRRVIVGLPGRLAERRDDRRLARGSPSRARPGSAGARPAPTARSCWRGRRPTSTRWWTRSSAGRDGSVEGRQPARTRQNDHPQNAMADPGRSNRRSRDPRRAAPRRMSVDRATKQANHRVRGPTCRPGPTIAFCP